MKTLLSCAALALMALTAQAGEPALYGPLPAPAYDPAPGYLPGDGHEAPGPVVDHGPVMAPGPIVDPGFHQDHGSSLGHLPVALYPHVKIEDRRNIHPCAVEKIVPIKVIRKNCHCTTPECVYVKICVPPCACLDVETKRGGTRVKYDYGKYRVELSSRRGVVKIDYDD